MDSLTTEEILQYITLNTVTPESVRFVARVNALMAEDEGLRRRIAQKPIIGSGLGANLDDVRSDGKAEYMYMDITMKTGFVGIILMFVTFFGFCVKPLVTHFTTKAFQKEVLWSSKRMRNHVLLAALVGVAVTSIFNPFLANPMGIAAMMITAAAYAVTGKEEE